MSQSTILSKLKVQGFSPVSKKSYGTVLKSNSGLAIAYNDGNVEGFIKQHPSKSNLDEYKLRHYIEMLIILGLGITHFNTDITIVDGKSMQPTYTNYQLIIRTKSKSDVNKILVSKNSIIKFVSPEGDTSIKRVVGVPGDTVELNSWITKVNGEVIDDNNRDEAEKHLSQMIKNKKRDNTPVIFQLQNDEYYVMGDNREDSADSRKYGPIQKLSIISVLQK